MIVLERRKHMRCALLTVLALYLTLSLCACGASNSTWQEQYDLGVRYLSDGNYEEAIIAFTAVIEIDPKNIDSFLGRASAYIGSGETEENLAAALADYQSVLEFDDTRADAYLGMADVYIRQDNYSDALDILQQGILEANDTSELESKINEIKESQRYVTVRTMRSDDVGGPWVYGINEYNLWNELIFATLYNSDDTIDEYWGWEYDDTGHIQKYLHYNKDKQLVGYVEFEYDSQGNMVREVGYDSTGKVMNEHQY